MILPLHHLKPGQSARVIELKSDNPARLDRLSAFGLVPGSMVRLEQIYPALIFRVGETEVSVDKEVASEIWVMTN
jgi:Fe2+ transport system protein FeoA